MIVIRQVVSFLASGTILERRRKPTHSLPCWYCTRLRRESPEIDAKSVRCDYYRGQVLEEEYFFHRLCQNANRSALLGVLCIVDFPMRHVLPAKRRARFLSKAGF